MRRSFNIDNVLLHSDYKKTFSTPEGQRVLSHIMKVGFVTRPTIGRTPEETMSNEGMRRLALSIMRFVKKDHEAMVASIAEEYENEA